MLSVINIEKNPSSKLSSNCHQNIFDDEKNKLLMIDDILMTA